jgi:DNA replication and repair protein RecF
MLIRKLILTEFRNVPVAEIAFEGPRQFLLGANGQGKSNLLEAVAFLTAFRSFRAADPRNLIRHEKPQAGIGFVLEREGSGAERVAIKIARDGKELWYDETRVRRLSDHVGRFPTVVFSSQDLQLIRGSAGPRRRWMDLTLASMDAEYLSTLQTYSRAVEARNLLLKRPGADVDGELAAFDRTIAPAGARIVEMRTSRLAELTAETTAAYGRMSEGSEPATFRYETALQGIGAEGLLELLESGRSRDLRMGTTQVGPHRDDLRFEVGGSSARDFASEGQQRSLVLALGIAQAAWFQRRSRIRPVLLADDVLGELDRGRRERFWQALDPQSQVIATGTSLPDASLGVWQVFTVAGGSVSPDSGGMGAAD